MKNDKTFPFDSKLFRAGEGKAEGASSLVGGTGHARGRGSGCFLSLGLLGPKIKG